MKSVARELLAKYVTFNRHTGGLVRHEWHFTSGLLYISMEKEMIVTEG
jgi:hypothetical protein